MSSMIPGTTPAHDPTPYTGSTATAARPAGITVVALLALVSGLLGLCGALPVFGLSVLGIALPTGVTQVLGGLGMALAVVLAAGPLMQIAFAYGALQLRPWGWWLGVIGTGISVAGAILSIIGTGTIWTALTHALIPTVIFIYLLTTDVRRAFRV